MCLGPPDGESSLGSIRLRDPAHSTEESAVLAVRKVLACPGGVSVLVGRMWWCYTIRGAYWITVPLAPGIQSLNFLDTGGVFCTNM